MAMQTVMAVTRGSAPLMDDGLRAAALLGRGLPPAAELHLQEASRSYEHDQIAEWHLREAQAAAPDHAAVLIGLYRFYFYKNRLREALEVARNCLRKAAVDNGLHSDWHQVRCADACFDSYEAMLPRFYLFTLKGYAYLQLRLGNVSEGQAAVMKLLELDPGDKLGARVLLGVLERMGQIDDD
jgi:tetratricopeptide (TPR) repeat protein